MIDIIIKKLSTLAVLVLLFETAIRLLLNSHDFKSPSAVGGGIILVTAIILCIIFSIDYRYKEHIDNTIKQQADVIKSLSMALKQKNKTSDAAEKLTKDVIEKFGKEEGGNKSYSTDKETETSTENPSFN